MRGAIVGVSVGMCLAAGCGGSSGSGTPTAPAPTTTTVTVALRDVVLVGTTATATATATLSNGSTQAVTTGWRSDATSVATVTDGGAVTGVANGEATIVVSHGGRDGTKRIRVAPNYDGQWRGNQIITACGATGDLTGACDGDGNVIGLAYPITLSARHPTDLTVSGEFMVEGLTYPTFTTQIESDGSIRFASVTSLDGVRAETSWQMNVVENGRATGTIREKYSAPGLIAGELTYESTFAGLARDVGAAATSNRSRLSGVRTRIRALRR